MQSIQLFAFSLTLKKIYFLLRLEGFFVGLRALCTFFSRGCSGSGGGFCGSKSSVSQWAGAPCRWSNSSTSFCACFPLM